MTHRITAGLKACAAAGLLSLLAIVPSAQSSHVESQPALSERTRVEGVDAVFAKWTSTTPGCAVGVAENGKSVLAKGYGMADLEHDVRITPESIFEAGSVSKQFTAAAVLLLAGEGKLSIDDPVRKYVPELPDYPPSPARVPAGYGAASPKPLAAEAGGHPLLMRHMLNHTSGLRDWGNVAGIAGWPRTTRVHTHAHVLDIVSRQRALNFTPGTNWSYSNTGFNLAAIVVSRVSGMPFAQFSQERIFKPLGMTHTSWRDDYTRIVKGRTIAYLDRNGEFHTEMPFENVYGNGGLLTTVGDLLKWNENFTSPVVGDAPFVALQQQVGKFNDGRPHEYAFGLYNRMYKGVRLVEHSGSTAGYRAHLARFPDQRVSVAVLCNVTTGDATAAAHAVADLYLEGSLKAFALRAAAPLTAAEFDAVTGLFRNAITGVPLTIGRDAAGLRAGRTPLVAESATRFFTAAGVRWDITGAGAKETNAFGTVETFERVAPAKPGAAELAALAGTFESDEAETILTAAVEGGGLVRKRRPDSTIKLTPTYADAFDAGTFGTVIFRREGNGRVIGLSVSQDRVWDMRFTRR